MATLKARQIFNDERQTIVVVESVDCMRAADGYALGLFASSKPVAVVTSTSHSSQAVDIRGGQLDLDCLLRDVDELNTLIKRY